MKTTRRFGQPVLVDEVFEAWTSKDVARMRAATRLRTNGVDRHYLLQSLIGELYKLRKQPASRQELFSYGALFLAEAPTLIAELVRHDAMQIRSLQQEENRQAERHGRVAQQFSREPEVPHIEAFILLIRAHCEDERYEEARDVARRAREVDYATDEGLAYLLEGIEKRRRRHEKALQPKPKM